MLANLNTLVITGIEAVTVKVEVDIQNGLPAFELVGLAQAALKEARERVKSAIKNSGYEFPNRKIIINLAPADLRKEGSHFDLAIALGILLASEQLINMPDPGLFLAGELSLDGSLRPIPGVLPMCLELHKTRPDSIFIIPPGNSQEAALVNEIHSLTGNNLQEVCAYLEKKQELRTVTPKDEEKPRGNEAQPDFADIKGQETAKRAIQVAAAGGHNILLIGPPGGGKTMLARRMPSILPKMTREEVLETTRIYSVAGLLNTDHPLIDSRPFRAPHKNASAASIIGGGRIPRPGEISLAQNGVLFFDEFPEFSRDVLEALRQPLEDKVVTVARAQATHTYPADFSLIASMNPCQCGFYGSDLECTCTPLQIQKYLGKISGPLLDRMDLHVEVPRVNYEQLRDRSNGESSNDMREKVMAARDIQKKRFARYKISLNSQMRPADVKKFCHLDAESEELLKNAFNQLKMSARAYDRILKVARTIADIGENSNIKLQHLAEALQYRSLDRKYWRN
ncbi:Magnesium chelatase, ChlI subunit [Syntrophomonas zehnderi OL-4]|uniref:Magnesium chelatase, ChlI subunit n=1 Tax=Syntrophomonas zehnderi OL-4 TaxID=690567 RepID=A0A0E4GBV1_9FIRM|nr:YifB family Mg chelatase-like AAA ATPase [Syntrophomonas zehnderi]CFX95134.1 Magnesium chelatase, ChlI subunit [Syntrophomonas zehnderi OL-4]